MAGMKCIYCSKVCETTYKVTEHLSIRKCTMRCTIPRQTQHRVPKTEATIPLTEQMLG